MIVLRRAAFSRIGLLRQINKDAGFAGRQVLSIADAEGPPMAGRFASAVAVRAMSLLDAGPITLSKLDAAVRSIDAGLAGLVENESVRYAVGKMSVTTLVCTGTRVAMAHVGNCRGYIMRQGTLRQVTRDHSMIGRKAAAIRPHRSPGGPLHSRREMALLQAEVGDRLLLCSDGLTDVVDTAHLCQVLACAEDAVSAAERLRMLADERAAPDNVTCIVADIMQSRVWSRPADDAPILLGAASAQEAGYSSGPSGSRAGGSASV